MAYSISKVKIIQWQNQTTGSQTTGTGLFVVPFFMTAAASKLLHTTVPGTIKYLVKLKVRALQVKVHHDVYKKFESWPWYLYSTVEIIKPCIKEGIF